MERWASALWRRLPPHGRESVELLSVLRRQCDDRALILDHHRALIPNEFTIELLPAIHRELAPNDDKVARALADQVRRHAAERHYTFAGPVVVALTPASGTAAPRFRVRSRIAPPSPSRSRAS
ncbi:hypothetical protein GCM10010524_10980 [Streptomyces mexicanus]|jgi:hypothetical protein